MAKAKPLDDLRAIHHPECPLDGQERAVLTVLVLVRDNETLLCNPGLRRIAAGSGFSVMTVRKAIERLHNAKFVDVEKAPRKRSSYTIRTENLCHQLAQMEARQESPGSRPSVSDGGPSVSESHPNCANREHISAIAAENLPDSGAVPHSVRHSSGASAVVDNSDENDEARRRAQHGYLLGICRKAGVDVTLRSASQLAELLTSHPVDELEVVLMGLPHLPGKPGIGKLRSKEHGTTALWERAYRAGLISENGSRAPSSEGLEPLPDATAFIPDRTVS